MKTRRLLLLGLILAGCSSTDPSQDVPAVNKSLSTMVPEYNDLSQLKIPNGRRLVSLGDTEDHAFSVFPKPSRAFPLEEVVPGLPADFKSRGWESNTEGFGIILHDDKVVLAMRQFEAIEPDEFATLLSSVQSANNLDRFQAKTINKAEYWYVNLGQDRLIISRLAGPKKRYQVTVTLGNERLVDALGILKESKAPEQLPLMSKNAR